MNLPAIGKAFYDASEGDHCVELLSDRGDSERVDPDHTIFTALVWARSAMAIPELYAASSVAKGLADPARRRATATTSVVSRFKASKASGKAASSCAASRALHDAASLEKPSMPLPADAGVRLPFQHLAAVLRERIGIEPARQRVREAT